MKFGLAFLVLLLILFAVPLQVYCIGINTYGDPTCITLKTVFIQGDTVYTKANGLNVAKYYRIEWFDPSSVSVKVTTYEMGSTSQTDSYTLAPNASVGVWKVGIFERTHLSDSWTQKDTAKFKVWHAIAPVADSWVEMSNPNGNHGNDDKLRVRVSWDSDKGLTTNVRRSYLKFDLSSLPSNAVVTSAKLHLYKTTSSILIPLVFKSNDTWTEMGINWNNQPGSGDFIADGVLMGAWVEWDITDYAASEFTGDKTLSLVLKFVPESGLDQNIDFISSEGPQGDWDKRPWLEISHATPDASATNSTNAFLLYHISDSHGTLPTQAVTYLTNHPGNLTVITGDLADYGEQSTYQTIKDQLATTGFPSMVTRGNHDYNDTSWQAVWGTDTNSNHTVMGDFLVITSSYRYYNSTYVQSVFDDHPNLLTIWASHCPWDDGSGNELKDKWVPRYDFILVLHGHLHQYRYWWWLGKGGRLVRYYGVDSIGFSDQDRCINIIEITNGVVNHTYYDVINDVVLRAETYPISKSSSKNYDFTGHELTHFASLMSTGRFDKDYGRLEYVEVDGRKLLAISSDGVWVYNSSMKYQGRLRSDACIAAAYGDMGLDSGNELAVTNGTHVFVYNNTLSLISSIDLGSMKSASYPLPIRDVLIANVSEVLPQDELVVAVRAPENVQILVYNCTWHLVGNITIMGQDYTTMFPHVAFGTMYGTGSSQPTLYVIYHHNIKIYDQTLAFVKDVTIDEINAYEWYTGSFFLSDFNQDNVNELVGIGHTSWGRDGLYFWQNMSYATKQWRASWAPQYCTRIKNVFSYNVAAGTVSTPILATDDSDGSATGHIFDLTQMASTNITKGAYAICDLDGDGVNELYVAAGDGTLKVYNVTNRYFDNNALASNIRLRWVGNPYISDTQATVRNITFSPVQKKLDIRFVGSGTKNVWANCTSYGSPSRIRYLNGTNIPFRYDSITKIVTFSVSLSQTGITIKY